MRVTWHHEGHMRVIRHPHESHMIVIVHTPALVFLPAPLWLALISSFSSSSLLSLRTGQLARENKNTRKQST